MSTKTVDVNTDELTALKLLAGGHSIAFTAAASGLSEVETALVARRSGNQPESLAEAAMELQERLERALLDQPSDPKLHRHDPAARLATT